MAAAITWVLRDGVGMFGSLVFSYAVGAQFDVSVKEWRLFADLINDVGLTLDMFAPFGGPRGFVVIAALGAGAAAFRPALQASLPVLAQACARVAVVMPRSGAWAAAGNAAADARPAAKTRICRTPISPLSRQTRLGRPHESHIRW
jgi:hypothetical protein